MTIREIESNPDINIHGLHRNLIRQRINAGHDEDIIFMSVAEYKRYRDEEYRYKKHLKASYTNILNDLFRRTIELKQQQ